MCVHLCACVDAGLLVHCGRMLANITCCPLTQPHAAVVASAFIPQGTVTASSPTCIRWVPGSDGLFVVACADGALYVYDADRDRNDLQPLPLPSAPPLGNASISAGEHRSPTDGLTVVHAKGPRLNPLARWHFGTAVGAVSEIA
eukprot:Opistho-2@57529